MLVDAKDFFIDGRMAKHKQIPILVMFSAPNCPYCELVKQEVIRPMSELKEYQDKIILRHIFYSSLEEIIDFSGQRSNHSQFSFKYNTKFYPTLMLFDNHGNVLEKKIGVTLIETYWTELDTLITQATKQLKAIL
ncbi:thioredoxin family protein [Bathymodiolus thermophilus thioautotrophic gill symbiont]|uniref:thioredoxin family protein n=1 Tax=Bathymodiolus thermophilus thioautotrophic gill symbiont TaxID=2360 RepID=UPI000F076E2E|nr:thioredoxin fold domain-containing protein [Bathymodiolus thermophilus thioautotrophic gill symbiont]